MNQKQINLENTKRLDILHRKHRKWLEGVAFKITKSRQETEDIISELYVYLLEKGNEKLWYNESYNLMYCRAFIQTRYINKAKRQNRFSFVDEFWDTIDEEYDYEEDKSIDQAYESVIQELNALNTTKMWSSALIFQIYMMNEFTMEEVSESIGISKSTVFLNNKKIKQYLKQKINNPFNATNTKRK